MCGNVKSMGGHGTKSSTDPHLGGVVEIDRLETDQQDSASDFALLLMGEARP